MIDAVREHRPDQAPDSQDEDMGHKYTRDDVVFGMAISLILLCCSSVAAWHFITMDIKDLTPYARFVGIWFSLMIAIFGLSGVLRLVSLKVHWLATVASVFWCGWVSMFGLVFIILGFFSRESMSGGIPFLPHWLNSGLGSLLFIAFGLVILAVIPKLFRHQQKNG